MHIQKQGCLLQRENKQWVANNEIISQDRQVNIVKPREKSNLSIPQSSSTSLAPADRAEILTAGRKAAWLLSTCMPFRDILLPYVCSLPSHKYRVTEIPQSCLEWDQKSWSHIYRCVTYGFKIDPGNSSYSYGMHLLLIELSPIGRGLTRLQEMHKMIASGKLNDQLQEAMGDVLEAVGGICDIRSIQSRILQAYLHAQCQLDKTAFRDVSDKIKNLAHFASLLQKFYPSHEELIHDIYNDKQVTIEDDTISTKNTASSHDHNESQQQDFPMADIVEGPARVEENAIGSLERRSEGRPDDCPANGHSAPTGTPNAVHPRKHRLPPPPPPPRRERSAEINSDQNSSRQTTVNQATGSSSALRKPAVLPPGDRRLHFSQRAKRGLEMLGCRVCVCDSCGWMAYWNTKILPWQGAYIHHEANRAFFEQAGVEYTAEAIKQYYEDGSLDVT